jgi:Fe-S cluster assembly iron-binding protein IscA
MINVSTKAVDKLKEELVQKCLEAGIGFRIIIDINGEGKITSTMRFDRQRHEDVVIDLGAVKLFSDPASILQMKNYHLDYLDNPDGGFFLIKKPVRAGVC